MASGRRMRTAIHKFIAEMATSPELRDKIREMFTEHDYDPNQLDMDGNSYLHHVLRLEAHIEDDSITVPMVYLLGNAGIDATLLNDNGEAPLHMALQIKCTPMMISALLKIGADPLQPNRAGMTPLRMAVKGDDDTYRLLFVNRPGLFQAAKQRDIRKIDYLMGAFFRPDPMCFGVKLADAIADDPDVQFAVSNQDSKALFFHACLAGDAVTAREFYHRINKDSKIEDLQDPMFFDDEGQLPMSLMGYALLLNLTEVAQFLLEVGADVNRKIEVNTNSSSTEPTKIPLFWYCMLNCKKIEYGSALSTVMHKADIGSLRRDAPNVLYLAWQRKWPLDVVQPFAKAKNFLSRRNLNGHTGRDLILIRAITARMITWREELYFIDRHVREMLEDYDYAKIEELVLSGYEQVPRISIQLPEPANPQRPTLAERSRLENAKKLKELLDGFAELKKASRIMFASIETGNMPDFREAGLTMPLAVQMTDKASRTMLHLAVIFDRRVLAKYLIDKHPDLVPKKDIFGRTALHYAAALEESSELEEWIKAKGTSYQELDLFGKKPTDYDNEAGLAMVEDERGRLYGADAYCLEMYVRFEEAIKKGNIDLVQKLKAELNEIPIEVLTRDMYSPPQYTPPREIIFIAVDEDKEPIAQWLIKNGGAAWDVVSFLISRKTPKPINLYTAASLKQMEQLKRLIMTKEQEFKKQKEVDNANAEVERLKDVERQMKYEEKMIREGMLDDEIAEDLNDEAPDGWDEEGKGEPSRNIDELAMEEGGGGLAAANNYSHQQQQMMMMQAQSQPHSQQYQQLQQQQMMQNNNNNYNGGVGPNNKGCSVM